MNHRAAFIVTAPRMMRHGPHILLERWNTRRRVVLPRWHAGTDPFERVREFGVAGATAICEVLRFAIALVAVEVHYV